MSEHVHAINPEPDMVQLLTPEGQRVEHPDYSIDITDDGTVMIACTKSEGAEDALARVEAMTEEVKVGRIYNGTVSSVKDFGAFIEIAPGKDGLCHISELSTGFVKSVDEICKVGDKLQVKVIAIDDQNRVKLSRKAVLAEQGTGEEEPVDSADEEDDDE